MKGHYMTFRCRLCGKTLLENQPLMHETHCCEDGSFGVADFLGMKYREER